MPWSQEENYEKNIKTFIDCWNIYSGLYLPSSEGISRRMEATNIYSEMCVMCGGHRLKLAKDIVVTPDHFITPGECGETDYTIGFSLSLFNRDVGRITRVVFRNDFIYIASEKMTISFRIGAYNDYEEIEP